MSLPNANFNYQLSSLAFRTNLETLSIKLRQERITVTSNPLQNSSELKLNLPQSRQPTLCSYARFNKMAASRRLTPFFICDLELRRSHKLQYDFYMLIQSP